MERGGDSFCYNNQGSDQNPFHADPDPESWKKMQIRIQGFILNSIKAKKNCWHFFQTFFQINFPWNINTKSLCSWLLKKSILRKIFAFKLKLILRHESWSAFRMRIWIQGLQNSGSNCGSRSKTLLHLMVGGGISYNSRKRIAFFIFSVSIYLIVLPWIEYKLKITLINNQTAQSRCEIFN